MHRIEQLFKQYQFAYFEDEGVYIQNVFQSAFQDGNGNACASHAIGIYCNQPYSFSRFHKLDHDELWHFYEGDPFVLHLLYPNGETQSITMGDDLQKGEQRTFLVPAGTWQAGELVDGNYALFACTVCPAFVPHIYTHRVQEELIAQYPHMKNIIEQF